MIDVSKPNNARVYNYLLGGKDNFAIDREAAALVMDRDPGLRRRARLNRAFVTAASTRATQAGIGQFLDLGCGLPAYPSVHEVARRLSAGARVAYVDNDPVVFSHTNAMVVVDDGLAAAIADIRDPAAVLADNAIRSVIDLSQPACVIMAGVSQLLPAAQVAEITAGYMRAMPAGSWLVVSADHVANDVLRASLAPLYGADVLFDHSPAEFASFFSELDIVEPGIAEARRWLAGIGQVSTGESAYVLCAAGVKSAG
jgi:hypothetical protein